MMRTRVSWIVAVALVALILAGVIGLGATETFINKTGKTVTGIKIEFSKRVMITRHDSAFPDQSPSGRAQEFTFSGRDLRNLGRFSVSWSPSSGKVVDYEWIEKATTGNQQQVTTTEEEEFKLPDPNTPPILYGDDYPGPDEPLYEPKPDEQIWLTDLEGHEDIYDNDGIEINYASGFDTSTIGKIQWYRNGTYLPWLDNKMAMTNAEMKTFRGDEKEEGLTKVGNRWLVKEFAASPPSSHTDHAIMGYDYEVRISNTADHLCILKKTVKSGFRWRPKEVWAELGISWRWNRIDAYPFDEIVQFLNYLKADGFAGISIDYPCYVMTRIQLVSATLVIGLRGELR